jgi:hypothetical protein
MKSLKWVGSLLLAVTVSIFLFNYLTLQMPANKILKEDSRNVGVNINLHYKYFILPSTVIFNIKSLSGEKSASDVFRVFLNAAASLKNKTFTKVELYSKGKIKFFVKGTYFKQLGEEYGDQNVIYTIRTFPENLFLYDGTGAYQQWSGGWLGVISKQMEDFNDACKKWFLEDY